MPNKSVHLTVGALSGAVAAGAQCFTYRERNPQAQPRLAHDFAHVAGGGLFGALGGRVPDLMDPPSHPLHRGDGHDVAGHGAVWRALWPLLAPWVDQWRSVAEDFGRAREAAWSEYRRSGRLWDFLRAVGYWLLEHGSALLAGAPIGFLVGAASHVILDGGSSDGVPIAGMRPKRSRRRVRSSCAPRPRRRSQPPAVVTATSPEVKLP